MRPVRALVPLVPLALLVTGGCSEEAGPTQEQYAAAADGVCRSTDEKVMELYKAQWELVASGESATYADRPERWVRAKIVPEYKRMSSRLKGIRPPDGDRTYLADLYSDLDERITVLHNRPGDGREVVILDPQLRQRFASYGMEACPGPGPEEEGEGSDQ